MDNGKEVNIIDFFIFFKQKTAYEMRISDWSSDVCSSDLCSDTAQKHIIKGETYGRSFELYREPGTQDAGDRIEGGRNDRQRDSHRDDHESAEQRRKRRRRGDCRRDGAGGSRAVHDKPRNIGGA